MKEAIDPVRYCWCYWQWRLSCHCVAFQSIVTIAWSPDEGTANSRVLRGSRDCRDGSTVPCLAAT